MSKVSIGIINYEMGNHASVLHCLRDLGHRVRVSDVKEHLDEVDILILPGVGAFPKAMEELHKRTLVKYIQEQADQNKPIIGICLGMQLLTEISHEHGITKGLGLIPGKVVAMTEPKWHIGWNTLECIKKDPVFSSSDNKAFYFNHSFVYEGSSEYQIGVSHNHGVLPSIIRKNNIVGLQFHPEKSQIPGRELLNKLILDLCHA